MLSGDVSTRKLGYSSDFDWLIIETFILNMQNCEIFKWDCYLVLKGLHAREVIWKCPILQQ